MIRFRFVVVLWAVLLSAGCTSTVPVAQIPPTSIEAVGYVREGLSLPKGYLDPADLPDSLALLPPPPQKGSAAYAADQEAFEQAMQASAERQAIAKADAELEWSVLIRSATKLRPCPRSRRAHAHAADRRTVVVRPFQHSYAQKGIADCN